MAWGIRPKYEAKHPFTSNNIDEINHKVKEVLSTEGFTITNDTLHHIQVYKKLKINLMTFFSLTRPIIYLDVLITKSGLLTIKSRYDYTSPYATPINDSGKSKKIVNKIIASSIELLS